MGARVYLSAHPRCSGVTLEEYVPGGALHGAVGAAGLGPGWATRSGSGSGSSNGSGSGSGEGGSALADCEAFGRLLGRLHCSSEGWYEPFSTGLQGGSGGTLRGALCTDADRLPARQRCDEHLKVHEDLYCGFLAKWLLLSLVPSTLCAGTHTHIYIYISVLLRWIP